MRIPCRLHFLSIFYMTITCISSDSYGNTWGINSVFISSLMCLIVPKVLFILFLAWLSWLFINPLRHCFLIRAWIKLIKPQLFIFVRHFFTQYFIVLMIIMSFISIFLLLFTFSSIPLVLLLTFFLIYCQIKALYDFFIIKVDIFNYSLIKFWAFCSFQHLWQALIKVF